MTIRLPFTDPKKNTNNKMMNDIIIGDIIKTTISPLPIPDISLGAPFHIIRVKNTTISNNPPIINLAIFISVIVNFFNSKL